MESSRDDFVIAIRSAFLKKGTQQRFSLLSLIFFSIIFLILGNFDYKIIKFNRTVIKEIVYFSSLVSSFPENTIKKSFNKTSNHFKYYDDYQITKKKLQKLKDKELSKTIITYENIELKKLIDDYFVEESQVYAKVLIDKASPFLKSIIINKGSKNDIRLGMIAYDNNYLIGRVVEVNFVTSRVLLISDINSKVPVTIQPLNIEAIMSGSEEQKGKLQYIRGEKLINNDHKELIVVTSGAGGMFKSGIPIGKINSETILRNDEIEVDFYRDLSQLKYVKILSYKKENRELDESNKLIFEKNDEKIMKLNNLEENIKILIKQNTISEEIRSKLEEENTRLNKKFNNTRDELNVLKKKAIEIKSKNDNIKFLELNLIHGHKCRKTFLRSKLYKINTPKYKECVLNKGIFKKN